MKRMKRREKKQRNREGDRPESFWTLTPSIWWTCSTIPTIPTKAGGVTAKKRATCDTRDTWPGIYILSRSRDFTRSGKSTFDTQPRTRRQHGEQKEKGREHLKIHRWSRRNSRGSARNLKSPSQKQEIPSSMPTLQENAPPSQQKHNAAESAKKSYQSLLWPER